MPVKTYEREDAVPANESRSRVGAPGRFRGLGWVVRILVVLALVLVFVNYVLVPAWLPKTSESVLNAPTVRVRSEQVGHIQMTARISDRVRQGDNLATITNDRVDESPIWRLNTEKSNVEAELARLFADRKDGEKAEAEAKRALDSWFLYFGQSLRRALDLVQAKITEQTAALNQSQRQMKLKLALFEERLESRDKYTQSVEDVAIAAARLEQARRERDQLTNELEAAEVQVILKGDSPIEYSFLRQVKLSNAAIDEKIKEATARLAAVTGELQQVSSLAVNRSAGAIRSPINGVVWRVYTNWPHQNGDPLIEIAESGGAFVEALFQDSFSDRVAAGGNVVVTFTGLAPVMGKIRAFRQTSPDDLDGAYAIHLPKRLNQVRVLIDLDPSQLDATLIGRRCRVLAADPAAHGVTWPLEWVAIKLFTLLG